MITLGIETSCDECACGIVNEKLEVLANRIYTQEDVHREYGGVVPEIAARAHLEKIYPVVQEALIEAQLKIEEVDLIAYTRGPGLIGALLVGASFAQGLGRFMKVPTTGISHLEGHLAASLLSQKELKPPFICLTVSGGHTELCYLPEFFEYQILGKTRDDAAGEAFDKCGKILNLGYPAGPIVSKLASTGDRNFFDFPKGLNKKGNYEFSFSGLKTAFYNFVKEKNPEYLDTNKNHICASLETSIVNILVKKTIAAAQEYKVPWITICGGVSANRYLRERMTEEGNKRGIKVAIPDFSLCTDNGAMIAGIAQLRHNHNKLNINHKVSPSLAWDN